MSIVDVPAAPAALPPISLSGLGVRFDFDRQGRVVTPVLRRLRRVRASAWGLDAIDLELEAGSGVALVGATGSGKTTLLRVLAGVLPADAGKATIRGRVGSLLAGDAGLQMLLTGRENSQLLGVLAGLSLAEAAGTLDVVAERARLGDAFDRPVHTYSAGMRARLGLAVIQSISPRVLLLDEVFEALDHEFRGIVENYARALRDRGGVVVAAGHDHVALSRICPRAVWLAGGRIQVEGPIETVIDAYRAATSPRVAANP